MPDASPVSLAAPPGACYERALRRVEAQRMRREARRLMKRYRRVAADFPELALGVVWRDVAERLQTVAQELDPRLGGL